MKIPRPYLHNVFVLATAQAFASSGLTVAVILGGIIAAQIAPRASLATVPISTAVVATALTTVPAALLMRRIGRRLGFMTGALFSQPAFRVAVIASAIAYAVMTFIMTAAPISMHNFHHFDVEATTWVVQSHVLAMFLPSLFTGYAQPIRR